MGDIVQKAKSARLIALCGSAGSFQLILKMLENIPSHNTSSWVVMLHRNNNYRNNLVGLLQNHTSLPVKEAEDKENLEPGTVYVAPIGYHLLLDEGFHWSLDSSEPVWFCRPAIDLLLHSMSDVEPKKMCAFLMSGANEDGARGLKRLYEKGGLTFIQAPEDAEYRSMPEAAKKIDKNHKEFFSVDIKLLYQNLFKW